MRFDKIDEVDRGKLRRDMIYSLHRFGISFDNYWVYDFCHRNVLGRKIFVSDKLRYAYCELLNGSEVKRICTNKFETYKYFKKYYKRDLIFCSKDDDFDQFEKFCIKYKEIVIKSLTGHSGHGVNFIVIDENIDLRALYNNSLANGPFVLESVIKQGEEMSAIHPNSINTIRVVTFLLEGEVKILGITLRMGCGQSKLDNAGAGGIYALVNSEYGIVESKARNYRGDEFLFHPDTGVVIPGYQLPNWDEALCLINNLPRLYSGFVLISWDLAYSRDGWVLVEVNDNGEFMLVQKSDTVALKKTLYDYMDIYLKSR